MQNLLGRARCRDPRRDCARSRVAARASPLGPGAQADPAAEADAVPRNCRRQGASQPDDAAKERTVSESKVSSVEHYLRALSAACREAADDAKLRPVLFLLLTVAPKTICELLRAERQAARRLAA